MATPTNTDPFDHPALRAAGAVPPILARPDRESLAPRPIRISRRMWLGRLRRALAEDLFVLHFQPILSLGEDRITHHEALLRLADDPEGELVGPSEFLPAAERHGLICEIDRMVLDKAAALLAGLQTENPDAKIAINVSALSVTHGAMPGQLDRALARHGADPAGLIVEITETTAISDMTSAQSFCSYAQRLGCAVALDDFGAGFGSFQYLKHLPFDYLKIDGGFVRSLPSSRIDQLLVKALVGVVRGIGRRTVAEFVGDGPTLEMLRSYGVDYAQGYAIGRPGPELATAWPQLG
jgi:EAL domain-containing protein (putative c-di-GMP-specific phosphodiesterase class I)